MSNLSDLQTELEAAGYTVTPSIFEGSTTLKMDFTTHQVEVADNTYYDVLWFTGGVFSGRNFFAYDDKTSVLNIIALWKLHIVDGL
jgi:hypothetical protein